MSPPKMPIRNGSTCSGRGWRSLATLKERTSASNIAKPYWMQSITLSSPIWSTGTTMYAPQLIGERLGILNRIVPNLDKVAMALNGNNVNNAAQYELLRSQAQKRGIQAIS